MIQPESLRIAFVTDTVAGLGGGVSAARHVVDALRSRGHEVRVVAFDAPGAEDLRLAGFQLPVRAMQQMHFTMARPDRALLARAFHDVDIIHVQFPFWLGIVAVEEARRAGKPVVAAFHVQPENALLNVGIRAPWLNRRVYHLWLTRFFNRADAVVCPTPFAQRKLQQHGLVTPSYVISNGVPPDLSTGGVTREEAFDGKFVVLAVGRLAAEKRQDVILEAVRRSRHRDRIRLVIAGAGPLEEELRARAAELPVSPEIGFLPRERLARLFATADVMVHASEVELEGIAVLEAMSKGLPVVVAQSDESAASEFALSDEFRFPAGDADALAARLDAFVEHPERLAPARESYRAMALRFDFTASVASLVSVYQRLLRRHLARTPIAFASSASRTA